MEQHSDDGYHEKGRFVPLPRGAEETGREDVPVVKRGQSGRQDAESREQLIQSASPEGEYLFFVDVFP